MQSTRHDPTLAALQAGAGLPGHVLDVVVATANRRYNEMRSSEQIVDSVSKWRFAPILKNGASIAQRASARVRFKLRD